MTKTLKIDIKTRLLSNDMQVHLIRPGAHYALYDLALRNNAIPADAPFLQAPSGQGIEAAGSIQPQLERSRVIRNWARKPKKRQGNIPTTSLDRYTLDLVDPDKKSIRTRLRNAAQEVLWDVPGGTLIVIPARSLSGDAILAEIAPRDHPRKTVRSGTSPSNRIEYPARQFFNPILVPMVDMPASVLEAARTVKVVEKISGHSEDRLLRMYFGDYERAGDHVTGLVSSAKDFEAHMLGEFLALQTAIDHFLKTNEVVGPNDVFFNPQIRSEAQFHARVDSPNGKAYVQSHNIAPFVAKLFLILAASQVAANEILHAFEAGQVIVENSSEGYSSDVMSTEIVQASKNALIDFARQSGETSTAGYLEALRTGIIRNSLNVAGETSLD